MDAREIWNLTGSSLLIQAFRIPRFRHIQRDINEDLQKWQACGLMQCPNTRAFRTEWTDETGQDQKPRIGHQRGDFTHAADVLVSIFGTESQISIQSVTDVVTIESVRMVPQLMQSVFDRNGHGAFPAPGETGEPNCGAVLTQSFRTIRTTDLAAVPDHIF